MAFATMNFFSRSLNRTATFNIIIPTDKLSRQKPLNNGPKKTLYLLHGILGNYMDWSLGTRIQALANARNLCVVMPSGDNRFYCDSALSGDLYGQFISQELVGFTRDTFRLSARREDTYIGGLSMGGYGAIVNALRHPEVFSQVVALSSALIKDRILSSVDEAGHDFFTRAQYQTMFGLKRIEDFVDSDCDYDALARRCAQAGERRPRFYMACGTEDGLIAANRAYRDELLSLGYDVTWVETPGTHSWPFWDAQIERALSWLPLEEAVEGVSSGNVG